MIFSGGVRTPLQFALGQSVSAAFSVSFVCSCCKYLCDYVIYLNITFIYHARLQTYNYQLIIVDNSYKRIVFYSLTTTYSPLDNIKNKNIGEFNFKITSLNVRGIRDLHKRRSIFTWIEKQKSDITFLQETYSTPEIINDWKFQWLGEMIFSHGSNHSRGVLVLINDSYSTK